MYNIVGLSENSKISKIEPDAKTKTKQQRNKQALFLQFVAGVLFLLDNYLKEEKYLYLQGISEHNEAFSMQGCCHAHKNISGQVDEHLAEILW